MESDDSLPDIFDQLIAGIEVVERDDAWSISIDDGVADLIDKHPGLLAPEVDAQLACRQAASGDDGEQMRLDAVRQVLEACREHGDTAPLRDNMEKLRYNIEEQWRWAMSRISLGELYCDWVRGDRAKNLEQAIAFFKDALTVFTRDANPHKWALVCDNLGGAYFNRLLGDRGKNLERAIACFEDALTVHTRDADLRNWAATRSNLGNTYVQRLRGDRGGNLERAVACFEDALNIVTRDADPHGWATTRHNLGLAYLNRRRGDRAENLERAVACFEDVLNIVTREADPRNWAATCNNLGNTYAERLRGDRGENLECAVACFEDALTVRTRDADPGGWAATRSNLGNVYAERLRGDQADDVERAIACYEDALTICTRDADPREWAATTDNLGGAYVRRLRGDRGDNLEHAITCYEDALTIRTRDADPHGWAMTHFSLGTAYAGRFRGDREDNLEKAIECCEAALTVFSRYNSSHLWATAKNYLAGAYVERLRGDRGRNLERAITCCEDAIAIHTPDANPRGWAETCTILAQAYAERVSGNRADNLRHAAAHLREALPVTALIDPGYALQGTVRLGELLLELGEVEEALAAWRGALLRREALLRTDASFEARADAARRGRDLIPRLALLELSRGEVAAAAATLERGRALGLREALALDDVWLSALPGAAAKKRIVAAREHLAKLRIASPRAERGLNPGQVRVWEHSVVAAEAELAAALNAAGFAPLPSLDAAGLAALAPRDGALVLLAVGSEGGAAVVLPSGCEEPGTEHTLMLPGATTAALREMLFAWFDAYDDVPGHAMSIPQLLDALRPANATLEGVLGQLWDAVMGPVLERVAALGVAPGAELVLLPHGDLALLPLHAAGHGVDGARRAVLDEHVVSYAPSGALLRTARQRLAALPRGRGGLFGLFNPMRGTEDALDATEKDERPRLEALFGAAVRTWSGPEATVERALTEAGDSTYVHFACHASFSITDPEWSGLQLAGGEVLSVRDIVQRLRLPANRWVALSACETAMVDVEHLPDEFVGLPAAFLQAGAPGVVATLWSVYDQPTTQLMPQLYRQHLEHGLPPAAALRGAVLRLRQDGTEMAGGGILRPAKAAAGVAGQNEPASPTPVTSDMRELFSLPIIWAAYSYHGV